MTIIQELSAFTPERPTICTVGVFDGVHIGHQTLLKRLVSEAAKRRLLSGVITFHKHPMTFLAPGEAPPHLASSSRNLEIIRTIGVDLVIPLTFDAYLAQMDAPTFAASLQQYLNMQGLILGWDFAMGHHRSGTLITLADLGKQHGFTTEVVPAVTIRGETVSSTAIRQALAGGDLGKANAMLGYPFILEGQVVAGAGRGTGLGFPTANISTEPEQVVPAEGVYATRACLDGTFYPSVTAISRCPTFNGTECTIEAHLLDFSGDIYRRTIRLDIIEYMRPPRRFDNPEDLKGQIVRDVTQAKEILLRTQS